METGFHGTDGWYGRGRQPLPEAVLDAAVRSIWMRLDGLQMALEISGPEGQDVIRERIRAEFRDLEAVLLLADLLAP